ncbi:MAG: hypothetical protein ABEJ85_02395 [Haloarculaceae archaeon]
MTLAADTREAVRRHPFLVEALRAGVVNYSAAARFLDVDGETDAVVAALRRFAADLDEYGRPVDGARVTMESGFGPGDHTESGALLVVGETALVPDAGSLTAIVARDDFDSATAALRLVLGRLETADVTVEAAAGDGETVVVVVGRRDGPDALRAVEDALGA